MGSRVRLAVADRFRVRWAPGHTAHVAALRET